MTFPLPRALAAGLLLAGWAAGPTAAQPVATPGPELLLLDLQVNGQPQGLTARAELHPGTGLVLPADTWTQMRLVPPPPSQAVPLADGSPGFALAAVAGLSARLDRGALTLDLQVPVAALHTTHLGRSPMGQLPPRPGPGLFIDYDTTVQRLPGAGGTRAGALVEAGAFGPWGRFVTSGVARLGGSERGLTRLDTAWRYEMPERMESLVLGDAVGSGGGWSRPVRFGGLRWGRDFGLRPGFITLPQLSLAGEAALPSTVDVLVNNVRRLSAPVPSGPFDLSNAPFLTGAGEIQLVVRDLLGRETLVTQRYYAASQLLAPGLSDYSLEAGWLRSGYGETSRYGDAFAAGTWRRGLSAQLTAEARIEWQASRRAAGVDLAAVLGDWALARAAAAGSQADTPAGPAAGGLLRLGLERSTPRGSAWVDFSRTSAGFRPFGEATSPEAVAQRLKQQWLVGVSGHLPGGVSTSLNHVRQARWDGSTVASVGASAGLSLGGGRNLHLWATRRLSPSPEWRATLTLTLPLGAGVHGAARTTRETTGLFTARASAWAQGPAPDSLGWRVEASTEAGGHASAQLRYEAPRADLVLDLSADRDSALAARASARGMVGLAGGQVFAGRPLGNGSVAVVELPDLPGVPVRHSNRVVAHTDASGRAVVSGLLPWHDNRFEIDPVDLPLDVEMPQTRQVVVPYPRTAVVVRFEPRRSRQALVVLHQPGGEPVPVGAQVLTEPQGGSFLVGRRGEVWLTDLQAQGQRLHVSWPQGHCALDLALPPADGQPATLGPLACASAAAQQGSGESPGKTP